MEKIVAGIVAAVAVATTVSLTAPAAQAYESWQDWNSYSTTLPYWVAGPTAFTVTVDGPKAVCSMTYNDTTLTAAPWAFTYDPNSKAARNHDDVTVNECDGATDNAYLRARAPFSVIGDILPANGHNQTVSISNQSSDFGGTAVLTDAKGNVLSSVRIEPDQTAELAVDTKGVKATTTDTVTVTADNGLVQTFPIVVAKGWATFDFLGSTPNYAACSTVTWAYDAKGQQAKAKTFKSDIQPALDRIGKETGLKFVYTEDYANAGLRFHWGNAVGAAATGGTDGDVTVSTTNYWPTDKYAGFAAFKPYVKGNYRYTNGPSGRGWLIIHEVLHSLGFDHVMDTKSVMAPVNRGQHTIDQGTLEGLHAIYLSKCAK